MITKKGDISTTMLAFIIIAVIAMTIFILFFTGFGSKLFGQFGEVAPSESETARDACQIACNNAKLRTACDSFNSVWCNRRYGNTEKMCWEMDITCEKNVDDETCPSCETYLEGLEE